MKKFFIIAVALALAGAAYANLPPPALAQGKVIATTLSGSTTSTVMDTAVQTMLAVPNVSSEIDLTPTATTQATLATATVTDNLVKPFGAGTRPSRVDSGRVALASSQRTPRTDVTTRPFHYRV